MGHFGKIVSDYRHEHDLSYHQMHAKTGVPVSTIHLIATSRTIPRRPTVLKLVKGLHLQASVAFDAWALDQREALERAS